MWTRIRWPVIAGLVIVFAVAAAQTASQKSPVQKETNPDALLLVDYQKRIKQYMDVRGDVDKGAAEQKETSSPEKIRQAQVILAERIRTARKTAKAGDIFTPEIRTMFRRLMYPELKGAEGRETKETIKADAPKAVPLKVNTPYPDGAPRPTVPPNILANLPQLPEELEYRIINRDLILLDTEANLIVDFIPNAIR